MMSSPLEPKMELDESHLEAKRLIEALLFTANGPLSDKELAGRLQQDIALQPVMQQLRQDYAQRGIQLVRVQDRWLFRTAPDLAQSLSQQAQELKKPSRAALETMAIIAYHQPVTRAEIEDIRGVSVSKGTLDTLIEAGWVRLRGRRCSPGRPVTYGTTVEFLLHFGLEQITDLPGLEELQRIGLFEGKLPKGFGMPSPDDSLNLREDEDPLGEVQMDPPIPEEEE